MDQALCMRIVPLSTDFVLRELETHEYGYDYAQTVRELSHAGFTYAAIAQFCGYSSRNSIHQILSGTEPFHGAGERLYAMYVEVFARKPPQKAHSNGRVTQP